MTAQPKFNPGQQLAIDTQERNILVSASAGSGKTMVLVQRILKKLISGSASIDELIVVTFTEAAAREMKERLQSKLKEAVNNNRDPVLQRQLLKHIEGLPQAHIQTLHSFCLFVLKNYFHVIDIDPNFTLLTDEVKLQAIYKEAWEQVNEAIFEGDLNISSQEYQELLSIFSTNYSDQPLYQMILNIYHFSRSHPEPQYWLSHLADTSKDFEKVVGLPLFEKYVLNHLSNVIEMGQVYLNKIQHLIYTFTEKNQDKYQQVVDLDRSNLAFLQAGVATKEFEKITQALHSLQFKSWPANSEKKNPDDYEWIAQAKDYRDKMTALFKEEKNQLFQYDESTYQSMELKNAQIIESLMVLSQQFVAEVSKIKQALNVLDYNDLEHLTLEILAPYNVNTQQREKSAIATQFQEKFKELLIDEYQDINEIQGAILYWLSRNSHPELANNLFMVGDVKQSIYGFRMAEPRLFLEKYQAYQKDEEDALIILDANYRSKNEVLQFTNFIFERLMDNEFGEMVYGQQESLKFGDLSLATPEKNQDFKVEILVHDKGSLAETDDIDHSLEAEAHLVAQKIINLKTQGYQIMDKKASHDGKLAYRPVDYKDMVILTATKKPFLTLQQVFQQYDIPIFTQKIENYYQRYEIQLMLALLQIIDNPFQDIPLVAVLRSFIVGLSDEDLAVIRLHRQEGSYYEALLSFMQEEDSSDNHEASEGIHDKVTYLLTILSDFRELSRQVSVMDLILEIYERTQILTHFSTMTHSEQRVANLHGLYEQAKVFESDAYQGLFGFISYILDMMDNDKDIAEPQLISDDQNHVRLMTVHASKGLEFPVVFLMNTGKNFNLQDGNAPYIAHREYGLSTKILNKDLYRTFNPLTYELYRRDLKDRLKSEEMRKLYVALTRCEQKLFIVGTVQSQEKAEKWMNQAKEHAQDQLTIPHSHTTTQHSLVLQLHMRQKAQSWLDWILAAISVEDIQGISVTKDFPREMISLTFYQTEEIQAGMPDRPIFNQDSDNQALRIRDEFLQALSKDTSQATAMIDHYHWHSVYPYNLASHTSSYQSVSELKRMYEEPLNPKLTHFSDRREVFHQEDPIQSSTDNPGIQAIRYTEDTFAPPKFMAQSSESLAIRTGNVTHLMLQHLDFSQLSGQLTSEAYRAYIQSSIQKLLDQKVLDSDDANLILVDKIVNFLMSELGQWVISHAGALQREQAFSYRLPAGKIFKNVLDQPYQKALSEDYLLIHGVIDNFILTEDELILIDYKTDRYRPYVQLNRTQQIQAIVDKYYFQVQIYAAALQTIFPRKKIKPWLVLLDFSENVSVPMDQQFLTEPLQD